MKSILRAWFPLFAPALLNLPNRKADFSSREQAPASGNTVQLLSLNQPPCATPSQESILTAKLAYVIAAQEQAEEGVEISLKFQSTNPKMTFSSGRLGRVTVSARRDTLTLSYPMAAVWKHSQLKRP